MVCLKKQHKNCTVVLKPSKSIYVQQTTKEDVKKEKLCRKHFVQRPLHHCIRGLLPITNDQSLLHQFVQATGGGVSNILLYTLKDVSFHAKKSPAIFVHSCAVGLPVQLVVVSGTQVLVLLNQSLSSMYRGLKVVPFPSIAISLVFFHIEQQVIVPPIHFTNFATSHLYPSHPLLIQSTTADSWGWVTLCLTVSHEWTRWTGKEKPQCFVGLLYNLPPSTLSSLLDRTQSGQMNCGLPVRYSLDNPQPLHGAGCWCCETHLMQFLQCEWDRWQNKPSPDTPGRQIVEDLTRSRRQSSTKLFSTFITWEVRPSERN